MSELHRRRGLPRAGEGPPSVPSRQDGLRLPRHSGRGKKGGGKCSSRKVFAYNPFERVLNLSTQLIRVRRDGLWIEKEAFEDGHWIKVFLGEGMRRIEAGVGGYSGGWWGARVRTASPLEVQYLRNGGDPSQLP
jgi:hypothetical protein